MRKLFSHAAIIISVMYLVFFGIDRVNTAMCFIDNEITKYLLVVLSLLSIINACVLIGGDRKKRRRQWQRQQKEAGKER